MNEINNLQFLNDDHHHCIKTAIADAEKICLQRKQRFTVLRKRVFELVWQQHKPIRAYDVLEKLQKDGRAAPPTVYRALDFLLDLGLIHRIESLNAFVGCIKIGQKHEGQFLICTSCWAFAELDSTEISKSIQKSAEHYGFEVKQQIIEVAGLCPKCQAKRDNA